MRNFSRKTLLLSLMFTSVCAFVFEANSKSEYYPPIHGTYTCDDSPKLRVKLQKTGQNDAYIVFSTGPIRNYRLNKNFRHSGRGVKFSDGRWSFVINGNTARVSGPWGSDVCDED